MISDELLEAVKTIHDECRSHEVCDKKCPFYRKYIFGVSCLVGGKPLFYPEDWFVERSDYD